MLLVLLIMGGGLAASYGVIEAAKNLRDQFGEAQPVVEETHTIVRVGSRFVHTNGSSYRKDPNVSYLRTQSQDGKVFVVGINKQFIGECQVGQTIAVERQGANATLTDQGCRKRTATVE